VTVACITIVSAAVATEVPLVPVIVTAVVDVGAPVAAAIESVDVIVLPDGGVTGLGLNPPPTPVGSGTARVTGELKPPVEETVTMIVAVPPGLRTTLLGLAEMPNNGVAVTVNVAVADLPVFPVTMTVYPPAAAPDDTVNPTVAAPPEMAHEGEANRPDGEEESTQLRSVGNPEAVPDTTVPTGPEVGLSTKVPAGPETTVKVALAESPAFV